MRANYVECAKCKSKNELRQLRFLEVLGRETVRFWVKNLAKSEIGGEFSMAIRGWEGLRAQVRCGFLAQKM
jgi:hypothetical protein